MKPCAPQIYMYSDGVVFGHVCRTCRACAVAERVHAAVVIHGLWTTWSFVRMTFQEPVYMYVGIVIVIVLPRDFSRKFGQGGQIGIS